MGVEKWVKQTAAKSKRLDSRIVNLIRPFLADIDGLARIALEYARCPYSVWDEEFLLHFYSLNPRDQFKVRLKNWELQERFVKALSRHPETEAWRRHLFKLDQRRETPAESTENVLWAYSPIIGQCNRSLCYYNSYNAESGPCICDQTLGLEEIRTKHKTRTSRKRKRQRMLL